MNPILSENITTNPEIKVYTEYFTVGNERYQFKDVKRIHVLKGYIKWGSYVFSFFMSLITLTFSTPRDGSAYPVIVIYFNNDMKNKEVHSIKIRRRDIERLQFLFNQILDSGSESKMHL